MRLIVRFAAAGSLAAALSLTGCGAGLTAHTADQVASVPGSSGTAPDANGNGTVAVRDARLAYPGTEGYPAGAEAPLEVMLFNDTREPVTVRIACACGTVTGAEELVIEPYSYAKPEAKLVLDRPVPNGEAVRVRFTFSNGADIDLVVPTAQPARPTEREKVELPDGSDGH